MPEEIKNNDIETSKSNRINKEIIPYKPLKVNKEEPKEVLPNLDDAYKKSEKNDIPAPAPGPTEVDGEKYGKPILKEMFGDNPNWAFSILAGLSKEHGKGSAIYDKEKGNVELKDNHNKKYTENINLTQLGINEFNIFNLSGEYTVVTKLEGKNQSKTFMRDGKYFLSFNKVTNKETEKYCIIVDKINDDGTLNIQYQVDRNGGILSSGMNNISLSGAIKELIDNKSRMEK